MEYYITQICYLVSSSITTASEIDKNIENDTEVSKNLEKYKKRKLESKDSNKPMRNILIGDRVLMKKDLDMNTKTKRVPFDSFYDDSVFQ
ncbi:hypothetical protein CWI39_0589p0040 [Hamiltosporidium magnivora]|uniref:Uncharacterized protein n=1 Tax=Hamiltosporidium magnivora TaxID=148818 RepID=A0A4Q9LDF6_9MICR|nr:hypothetical protein CWI39_0589p0040 [Hamiltosporidium magnivora]